MINQLDQQPVSALEIKNLSISFRTNETVKCIVDNIHFSLYQSKITALVGETGSGKTITGLALMGLLNAEISLSMSNSHLNLGQDITMIFQDPLASFSPIRKIKHHFKDVAELLSGSSAQNVKADIYKLFMNLGLVEIDRFMNSYPHQVSGGELQRISIALCLLQKPSILIADEPAAALDAESKKDLYELLLQLSSEHKMSILLITHDLKSMAEIAHEVLVLHEGSIVERGLAKEVIIKPKNAYTHMLVQSMLSDEMSNSYSPIEVDNSSRNKDIKREKGILTLKDVSVRYNLSDWSIINKQGVIQALNNVSFELYKGECVGIYGDSGSGKSTLLSSIMRMMKYTGQILFGGIDIQKLGYKESIRYNREIQFVFQNPNTSLNPRLSIKATFLIDLKMIFPNKNQVFYYSKMIQLLEDVRLNEDVLDRLPNALSGGQKQRVCIARALAFNPSILLCDEITSALDSSVQLSILNLLKELKRKHELSIIFVSHDLRSVRYMSDRIIRLDEGKLV